MSDNPGTGPPYQPDDAGDGAAALVRPYTRTGGRTKPGRELDLEALVLPTANGREAWESPLLSPEHNTVLEICQRSVGVARIAALLKVALGLDLAILRQNEVRGPLKAPPRLATELHALMLQLDLPLARQTELADRHERALALLMRVLSALQR